MIAFKLAIRNLIGAGLRTWLNVFVLSLSYVVIVWHQGFLDGWNQQAKHDTIAWEIGGGQYWHPLYDPYDPFALLDSHGPVPEKIKSLIVSDKATPILVSQGTIYPEGRMISVLMKGIDPNQHILELPTEKLKTDSDEIPAIIGTRMAKNSGLKQGSYVTVRWRDANGTFDAQEIRIVGLFKNNVPAVDISQIWIPIDRMQSLMQMPGEATIVVLHPDESPIDSGNWQWKDHDYLLADINQIIKSKSIGGSIMYIILMALAMLAIFDTQILSIFKRQREIGTHIALGMTRGQVIRLFTIEGAMHGILAAILAALYGIPFLAYQAKTGFALPAATDDYGMAIAERIFPTYGIGLILGTVIFVLIVVTIISYLPTRRISKMKPTDAIRGKIQ